MLCPCKAGKRLNFWLQEKPAGEADCLLMVREGKQELILAIIPQSLSSSSYTPPCLPPSFRDCEAEHCFLQGTFSPRRGDIILWCLPVNWKCLCPSLKNILNIINTSFLLLVNYVCLFLRNTHATMCLSCHLLLKVTCSKMWSIAVEKSEKVQTHFNSLL